MKSFIGLVAFLGFLGFAQAATLTGSAWSETIGWISFNGPLYGVVVDDTTGVFKGYAWSEHVGWINFNPAGPYPEEPSHSAKLDLITGKIKGWARACGGAKNAATCGGDANPDTGGDWDGWIKMNGFAKSVTQIGNAQDGCYLTGYAWGSAVIGWIRFDNNNLKCQSADCRVNVSSCLVEGGEPVSQAIECTFTAFPRRVVVPQKTTTLSWKCVGADSCAIYRGNQKLRNVDPNSSSLVDTPPAGTTAYTLKCDNKSGQSVSLFAIVTVIRSRICETIPYFPGC